MNTAVIKHLLPVGVTDLEMECTLESETNAYKRNVIIYDHLAKSTENKFNKFISVMRLTKQSHVANLLTGNIKGELPLSDYAYNWMIQNRIFLAEQICDSGFTIVDTLRCPSTSTESVFAITDNEYEHIKAGDAITQNVRLIDAICRRSIWSVQCFERVLRENHHIHVADRLKELLDVEFKTSESDENPPPLDKSSDETARTSLDRTLNDLRNKSSIKEGGSLFFYDNY